MIYIIYGHSYNIQTSLASEVRILFFVYYFKLLQNCIESLYFMYCTWHMHVGSLCTCTYTKVQNNIYIFDLTKLILVHKCMYNIPLGYFTIVMEPSNTQSMFEQIFTTWHFSQLAMVQHKKRPDHRYVNECTFVCPRSLPLRHSAGRARREPEPSARDLHPVRSLAARARPRPLLPLPPLARGGGDGERGGGGDEERGACLGKGEGWMWYTCEK